MSAPYPGLYMSPIGHDWFHVFMIPFWIEQHYVRNLGTPANYIAELLDGLYKDR